MQAGSYIIGKFSSNIENEVARLEGQLELFWEQELSYYRRCGLADGMTVLDCGSGPGHLIRYLADAFPSCRFEGVEIDPALIEISGQLLDKYGKGQCAIRQGSILETGFADDRFDFIVSRLVLEHLPDPVAAVKELKRILKPDGTIAIVANDFAYHLRTSPDIPELNELYGAYCKCRLDEGGNPYIGRELPVILRKGGLTNIRLDIIGASSGIEGDIAFLKSESVGISSRLVREGYLDKKTLDTLAAKWHAVLSAKDHAIFRQLFFCMGRKTVESKSQAATKSENQVFTGKRRVSETSLPIPRKSLTLDCIAANISKLIADSLEVDPQTIVDGTSFDDLGLDSISAVNLQTDILSDFGVELSIADFFDSGNLQGVSALVFDKLDRMRPEKDACFHEGKGVQKAPISAVDRPFRQRTSKAKQPLSFNQQSLWFLYQLDGTTPAYNIAAACRLRSEIDKTAFDYAINVLVQRHPVLRTTYLTDEETLSPVRIVNETCDFVFDRIDGSNWPRSEIRQRVEAYYKKPFDLGKGPVFRFHLFQLGANEHILLFVVHHIACDACSLNIFFEEFAALYSARANGREAGLEETPGDYSSHVESQNRLLNSPEGQRLFSFWERKIKGFPQRLTLPYDFPRPSTQRLSGSSVFFNIEGDLYEKLIRFSRRHKTTLYTVLLSAFQILLLIKSNQDELILGTIASGRKRKQRQKVFGNFVNLIPIPGRYDAWTKYRDYLKETANHVFEALDHQEYPFAFLVEKLAKDRDPDKAPIVQVVFNMLHRKTLGAAARFLCPLEKTDCGDFASFAAEPFLIPQQEGQFDMTLEVTDTGRILFSVLKYNTALFRKSTARSYIDEFVGLLETIVTDSEIPLAKLAEAVGHPDRGPAKQPQMQIAVAATFTIELVEEALRFWLKKIGVHGDIAFAPYNQVIQQLLDPASLFAKNKGGVNAVFIRFDDWLKEEGSCESASIETVEKRAAEFEQAVRTASLANNAPLVILFCPLSPELAGDPDLREKLDRIEDDLCRTLEKNNGVYTVSAARISTLYPVSRYYEPLGEKIGHIPYTQEFLDSLAAVLARRIYNIFGRPYKVIVLDCDNTLWNGIVGEDGVNGLTVDDDKAWFQRFIVKQRQAGMVLCLCSKNNPKDALDVFAHHPRMVLREHHITARKIDWSPKSRNIVALAKELNVGLDSFIFVDDNPLECAEVKAHCPEVLTIQFPAADTDVKTFFNRIWAFDHVKVTKEDAKRSEYYRNEIEREAYLAKTVSFADFIEGLDLRIDFSEVSPETIPRISQLTHRVNQFNLGAIGRSETDISNLCRLKNARCHTVAVSDRFGDYGLVGVVIAKMEAPVLRVDSFVLSCRAFGKGVEHKMAALLGEMAEASNLKQVEFEFIPTGRNTPALGFLESVAKQYVQVAGDRRIYKIPADIAKGIRFRPSERKPSASQEQKETSSLACGTAKTTGISVPGSTLVEIAASLSNIEKIQDVLHPANGHPRRSGPPNRDFAGEPIPATMFGDTEMKVAEVWEKVLRQKIVNKEEKFFEMGGKSILIPQIVILLKKKHGIDITIADFFRYPSVRALASFIDCRRPSLGGNEPLKSLFKPSEALLKQKNRAKMVRKMLQRKKI